MKTEKPWYQRALRWAQTNITEKDPIRYDIDWWRGEWKRTGAQGVIINAGGIITYYPSEYELSYRSPFLGNMDLFGEIAEAAREDGLVVIARMDSNRVDERFYIEHPDWIAVDKDGRPYKDGDKYITCIHSPYYDDYLPKILVEIGEKYHVDGYADNSYSGLLQHQISYSRYARERFKADTGLDLPSSCDWDDPAYREWIRWGYDERTRIWDLNNKTVRERFGNDCCWIGMIGGDVVSQNERFRDLLEIGKRTELIFLDHQSRPLDYGFRQNKDAGKLLHELFGWDKLIPESTAMYQHSDVAFRLSAKPKAEAQFWAFSGFAGGIQPWWHFIGAYHDDRRLYDTPVDLFQWHQKNEKYLVNREHIADIGVVYSPMSVDFYGRDKRKLRFTCPYEGTLRALSEASLSYTLIHIERLPDDASRIKTLIFPSVGAMTDSQIDAVKKYVKAGGSVIFSGETGAYDENGCQRKEYPFNDIFGINYLFSHHGTIEPTKNTWSDYRQHTYVRLPSSCKGLTDGPFSEPGDGLDRGPMFEGFEKTDILPFGGRVECVDAVDADVLMTFVPAFPVYPPELSWMKYPDSGIPALVQKKTDAGGTAVFMLADFDRLYCIHRLPDHGRLLGNIFRSVSGCARVSVEAEGDSYIDTELYRQGDDYILHMVNLTGTDKPVMESCVPVHDVKVKVKLDGKAAGCDLLVSGEQCSIGQDGDCAVLAIPVIHYHEVAVIHTK